MPEPDELPRVVNYRPSDDPPDLIDDSGDGTEDDSPPRRRRSSRRPVWALLMAAGCVVLTAATIYVVYAGVQRAKEYERKAALALEEAEAERRAAERIRDAPPPRPTGRPRRQPDPAPPAPVPLDPLPIGPPPDRPPEDPPAAAAPRFREVPEDIRAGVIASLTRRGAATADAATEDLQQQETLLPRLKKGIVVRRSGTLIPKDPSLPVNFPSEQAKREEIAACERRIERDKVVLQAWTDRNLDAFAPDLNAVGHRGHTAPCRTGG